MSSSTYRVWNELLLIFGIVLHLGNCNNYPWLVPGRSKLTNKQMSITIYSIANWLWCEENALPAKVMRQFLDTIHIPLRGPRSTNVMILHIMSAGNPHSFSNDLAKLIAPILFLRSSSQIWFVYCQKHKNLCQWIYRCKYYYNVWNIWQSIWFPSESFLT